MTTTPLATSRENKSPHHTTPTDLLPQSDRASASKLKLGIIDPGMMSSGKTARQTIEETLLSASLADSLGYSRYWLAEHHESSFAWACPEMLLASLAKCTDRIQLGTAGILLFYYSPLKIAEIFRLLELVYPQRFDIGLAAGNLADEGELTRELYGDILPAKELRNNIYSQKVDSLMAYLTNKFPPGHRFAEGATPTQKQVGFVAPLWLMGTGKGSMYLAAKKGQAYSYSLFHGASKCDPSILQEYRSQFQPNEILTKPLCNIAVSGFCAENAAEAKRQKIEFDHDFRGTTRVNVFGTLTQCTEQLLEIQARYQVDEIIWLSVAKSFEQRQLEYQMLAETFYFAPSRS